MLYMIYIYDVLYCLFHMIYIYIYMSLFFIYAHLEIYIYNLLLEYTHVFIYTCIHLLLVKRRLMSNAGFV